jgi:membrane protein YqaA with SNARE-associated domain
MDPYSLIFFNSFKSSVVFFLSPENAWFAALQFGGYNIGLATLAAVCGSSIGNFLNFYAGYYLNTKRGDWFAFSDKLYQHLARINRYTMFLLALPFTSMPFIGIFWGLYVLLTGFFGTPLKTAMLLIVLGRVAYYGYYLI